ncbi:MAG: hypothetical protein M1565_03380, partial [Actinobacteria bacterium]|nr:hypothetical protein [Actinomycetota bacterium]
QGVLLGFCDQGLNHSPAYCKEIERRAPGASSLSSPSGVSRSPAKDRRITEKIPNNKNFTYVQFSLYLKRATKENSLKRCEGRCELKPST